MKISIITVCYNSEKYIRSAIESVLNQTYSNIEHILVDGASKDTTMDIVKSYEPLFGGRMKWISEKDNGIYHAMNKGIALTTGDIVGILNSDDFYANNTILEKVERCFQEKNTDAVYGDLVYVHADKIEKIQRYWKSKNYKKNAFRWGWMPPHPAFFVKKDVYEKHGPFNTNFSSAADYEFMLRVIHKEQIKLAYLPEILIKMRAGGESNQSLKNRLHGNSEDCEAWKINGLQPYWFTRYLKPMRKFSQYIKRPKK
ncbi:MAG: glycosyltransferase [Bacteroidales bacterium]|nr:glycosyltransferase [Bacteroidales bacterium]